MLISFVLCKLQIVMPSIKESGWAVFLNIIVFVITATECPKFNANLYCICLGIHSWYTSADAVQICVKFWDTQYLLATETMPLPKLHRMKDGSHEWLYRAAVKYTPAPLL